MLIQCLDTNFQGTSKAQRKHERVKEDTKTILVCVCVQWASDSLYTRLFIVLHVQDLFPTHGTNPLLVRTSCNTQKKSHRYTNTASVPRLCERKEVSMVHTLAVVRARLVHCLLAYLTLGELCIGCEPRVRQQMFTL